MNQAIDPKRWYEVEEWIPPANARANVGYWAPVYAGNGKLYREKSAVEARRKFKSIRPGRKFRLVLVRRKVVAKKR